MTVSTGLFAQKSTKKAVEPSSIDRPKLIVGIVVDQMRYDYLYRYWEKYGSGGFKRLLREGFSCENTQYDYVPTTTGPGHAAIYSGATPSVNGIVGNNWYAREKDTLIYVTDDNTAATVGSTSVEGIMSPRNMLSSTITDELRLATNMQSKVIGVCLKDRGSILPAGHVANAAYWHDRATGNWISSTYYMQDLPAWVKTFNAKKLSDQYLNQAWKTLLPIEQYTESLADDQTFEVPFKGETKPVFPHNLVEIRKVNDYELLRKTPFGNTITSDMAIEAMTQEKMGQGKFTDFLTLSFSSTDYVGHQFGTHSIEIEDTYIRLDKELERVLAFLDKHVGKEKALVFLTADHGAANVPAYMKNINVPAGVLISKEIEKNTEAHLSKLYGAGNWVLIYENQQMYLNQALIRSKNLSQSDVEVQTAQFLNSLTGVAYTVTASELTSLSLGNVTFQRIQSGFNPHRSGDVLVVLQPNWFESDRPGGTTHGSGYSYDTHIPLLWYGWKVKPGASSAAASITDIAATLANMLKIMEPSGCTGKVLPVLNR